MLKGDVGRLKSGGRSLRKESAFGIQEKKCFKEKMKTISESIVKIKHKNKTAKQTNENMNHSAGHLMVRNKARARGWACNERWFSFQR